MFELLLRQVNYIDNEIVCMMKKIENEGKIQSCDDFRNMSDVQLIKTVLSYMCSKKEYEKAELELKNVVDISDLMNTDALCLEFGSYSNNSAVFLKTLKRLFLKNKSSKKKKKPKSEDALGNMFHRELKGELSECFCVAFLGEGGRAVYLKKYVSDKKESISIDFRDISKIATRLEVSKIAVAHNHPSGSLVCSSMDYYFMKEFCLSLKPLKISLDSHYIVSPSGYSKTALEFSDSLIYDDSTLSSECEGEKHEKE